MYLSKDITASLQNRSATVGWDAMVAYNRERVNQLFYQQYSEKVIAGENYPPFSHQNGTYGLVFSDIVLGPPLISFENAGIEDSAVTIRLKFLSGNIIRLDSDKQVIQWDHISPADEYAMKIHAELKYGSGSVSEDGTVSIHFNEGTLQEIEGMNDLPDEVLAIFRTYLQEHAMDYTLGELKQNDGDALYPKSFIVRTQRHPDAASKSAPDNTDGAVLLFIETNYGGKGNFPGNEQPWVIPDGKTATLLISDQLLLGPVLAQNFKERITNFTWESVYDTDGNRALQFTGGYVPTTEVMKGSSASAGVYLSMWSSDNSGNERPARLSMKDFTLRKGDDGTSIKGSFSQAQFTDLFWYELTHIDGHLEGLEEVPFNRSGEFTAHVSLDTDDNVIFNSVTNFNLKTTSSNWGTFGEQADEKFARQASDNLNKSGLFELSSIKTFYLSNLLFPDDHILNFSEVAIPADLVLYGDMTAGSQPLSVTPQEPTIAAGQTQAFSAKLSDGTTPAGLVWSLNGVGSIDSNGLYTAPARGEITQAKTVLVTASNPEGLTGTALLTVVVSPVEITSKFTLVKENERRNIQFTAHVTRPEDTVTWSVQSDSVFSGSIDQNGLYVPPEAGNYDDGFNIDNVIATLPSGEFRSTLVCLQGEETKRSFPAEPGFYSAVSPQGTADFSTQDRDFDADKWELVPALGELSTPESHLEGQMTVWSSTYTAPAEVMEHTLVMVRMSQDGKPWHGGYGLVELLPSSSIWSRVTYLSALEVVSANGTNTDSIYGNNVNQTGVVIKITAHDSEQNEVTLPLEDVYQYVELIDYDTGENISASNEWFYTPNRNEYSNQRLINNKGLIPQLYVTCNTGGKTKNIAVRVKLTNPDAEYEYYSTDRGSVSGMDSSVIITSKQPVDYTDPENLVMANHDPVKIKDNIAYSVKDSSGLYHDEYNGECLRYEVMIAPRVELSAIFKSVELSYIPVLNETVSDTTQNWGDDDEELSFSCLTQNKIDVCSVGGYRVSGENDPTMISSAVVFFDINNIESLDEIHVDGNIFFRDINDDERQDYRMMVKDFVDTPPVSGSGMLKFNGYIFRLPNKNAEPLGWSSTLNEIRATVTDNFGNNSILKLRWDDNQHYLIPSVS